MYSTNKTKQKKTEREELFEFEQGKVTIVYVEKKNTSSSILQTMN